MRTGEAGDSQIQLAANEFMRNRRNQTCGVMLRKYKVTTRLTGAGADQVAERVMTTAIEECGSPLSIDRIDTGVCQRCHMGITNQHSTFEAGERERAAQAIPATAVTQSQSA